MRRAVLAFAAVALLFLTINARGGDVEDLKSTFEQAVKALNTSDLDGFLATVHDRGLSFYSCGPTSGLEGKAACQRDWQKFFAKGANATFTPENFQFRVIGNTGIAWGDYKVSMKPKTGPERSLTGKYTLIYTKVDGKWLIVFQENSPNPLETRPSVPSGN